MPVRDTKKTGAVPSAKTGAAIAKRLKGAAANAVKTAAPEEQPHTYRPDWKAPKTLGAAADKLWELQEQRKAAQRVVDDLEAKEGDVKAWIKSELPKNGATATAGTKCTVRLVVKSVPRVTDWPAFYASVVGNYQANKRKKNGLEDGAFSVLQRRLSDKSVTDMWDAGVAIDGVAKFDVTSLSITKV